MLRIEGSGPGDLELELYDADRNKLVRAGAQPAGKAEVLDFLPAGATFHVKVSVEGEASPYELRLEPRRAKPGAEVEPNERAVDATALVPGTPLEGAISYEEDVDTFRLDLPPPAAPDERRLLRLELSGVEGLRPVVAVLDGDESPLGESKAREAGAGASFRNLLVRPDARLPLYVQVKSAWVGKGRRTAAPDARYTLSAKLEAAAADLEEEPNDDPRKATPIAAGQAGRLGFLAPAGDEDHFAVTVEKASIARLQVSGVERVDLELAVVDPEKSQDEELVRANDGGLKEGEALPNAYFPPGTSTIRVRGAARKHDGKWVRDLENPDQTYTLQVALRDAVDGDEREPNGTPAQATPIASGMKGRGFVHPRKDVDLYRIEVPAGGPRPLSATLSGVTRADLGLYLRGGTPDAKGELPVLASADKAKETAPEKLVTQVEGGTYYLEVKDTKGAMSNAADAYELEVVVGE